MRRYRYINHLAPICCRRGLRSRGRWSSGYSRPDWRIVLIDGGFPVEVMLLCSGSWNGDSFRLGGAILIVRHLGGVDKIRVDECVSRFKIYGKKRRCDARCRECRIG